ncbi:hypothetical protein BJ508DRAFT_366872 [Ascobolus immersus RN42]|uniref:F-box domain-containing protein n=1 Tax=Ascobolus immersus RN42 TaxID=1160509 RepID=A0A3N4HU15_ASCIM|nr:hypothetical protein BJ508DRAFT_366872 [Ascobolus immersus RN42]
MGIPDEPVQYEPRSFLSLPAEIRLNIYNHSTIFTLFNLQQTNPLLRTEIAYSKDIIRSSVYFLDDRSPETEWDTSPPIYLSDFRCVGRIDLDEWNLFHQALERNPTYWHRCITVCALCMCVILHSDPMVEIYTTWPDVCESCGVEVDLQCDMHHEFDLLGFEILDDWRGWKELCEEDWDDAASVADNSFDLVMENGIAQDMQLGNDNGDDSEAESEIEFSMMDFQIEVVGVPSEEERDIMDWHLDENLNVVQGE